MKKIVREHINEKFTIDSDDPIGDMGIGGYAFETLRKGAVIAAKVPGVHISSTSGRITSTGIPCPVDWPLLVISVRNYILKDHKEIKLSKPWKPEDIKQYRQVLKETGNISHIGQESRLIINKKQFDAKFNIIENGF